jgi:hypothetical protein
LLEWKGAPLHECDARRVGRHVDPVDHDCASEWPAWSKREVRILGREVARNLLNASRVVMLVQGESGVVEHVDDIVMMTDRRWPIASVEAARWTENALELGDGRCGQHILFVDDDARTRAVEH